MVPGAPGSCAGALGSPREIEIEGRVAPGKGQRDIL